MLIGLEGTPGSGVQDITRILCERIGFQLLSLESQRENTQKTVDHPIFKTFIDSTDLLNYVTSNWQDKMLISNVSSLTNIELFLKRPFFLLITIDSSLIVKFNRYKKSTDETITLENFCEITDGHLLSSNNRHFKYQDQAQLKLINNSTNIDTLHLSIQQLGLTNPERLRPEWDSYFMHFADLAAMRSNCMKRRVGCVIVKDKRVVATGYNGTPRGFTNCNEGGCYRCNNPTFGTSGVGLSTCLCLHAEENALLEAGRSRVEENSILYCNTCPCLTCSIKIVQVGITEVVYSQSYSMDEYSEKVFKEAGVKFRQFIPPTYGTVILD
jgi:dCMP deaminase